MHELHGAPLPPDRLLALELLEVDTDAGVARFSFELADSEGELWRATVAGWESRPEVRQRAQREAVASWIEGGVLTVPLTMEPTVTQIEVRRADLSPAVLYRITTQGMDVRTFRYRTELDTSEAEAASRWSARIEDTRPRFTIIEVGGRPVLTDEGGSDTYGVVEMDGRLVFDTEAAGSGDFTPVAEGGAVDEGGALVLVDDYDDEASEFVRPVAYTEPLDDADRPFDADGRPAFERGAEGDTWRQARAGIIAGAGLAFYRSESDG